MEIPFCLVQHIFACTFQSEGFLLLLQGLKYAQAAIYCQYNCQQLVLCACHALHAVSTAACQSNAPDRLSDQLAELLTEVAETTAVFSEPGWLLRLEGHIEDLAQITQLHAALTSLAATAGAARPLNSNAVGSAGFNTASPAGAAEFDLEEQSGAFTAGPAGGQIQIQALAKPDWSYDSDALRGRLLELGGVAGLQTDTDCLLLKDLCRPGLEDTAFLDLVDLELQVCQHVEMHVPDSFAHICTDHRCCACATAASCYCCATFHITQSVWAGKGDTANHLIIPPNVTRASNV